MDALGQLAVVLGLMLATVLLVGVGERIRRPYPVLVLLLGVVLALVPGIPMISIEPDLILPLFLPPLIFAAAQRTSWAMLWAKRRTVLWMAGALVLVTVAAVAWTAWLVIPGVTVAAAVALGALTAPPDPVAAEAVAEPLKLPRRLVTTLQTEGLCNDATALVVYGGAVAAMASGSYSLPTAVLNFLYEATVAVLLGIGVGLLAKRLRDGIAELTARSGLTLVVPFATYLAADAIAASGVLAVLAAGLTMGRSGFDDLGVSDRLYGGAFWDTLELLITGLAFGLIGLELREVIDTGGADLGSALLICLTVVVVRFVWMMFAGPIARRVSGQDQASASRREDLVLGFCGMRGLATLALALALPLATPARGDLLLAAFAVIVVTLVLPGLTLPTLVSALGVRAEADALEAATKPLAIRAGRAALARLEELERSEDVPDEIVGRLRGRQRMMLAALGDEPADDEFADYKQQLEQRGELMRKVRRIDTEMVEAARREILTARREPGVDPQAADQVLHRLDLHSAGAL
ncbi:cation:proton antiporter [Nonomuraea soli]|uniref:CPA1 family monovalent cation:H+ antiporter n=1 Tax=Nonomuraea soli TaxID=1032476 RepID=A0A7W0CQ13_9ACTN|nr:sodium:proton antiporter [Nonomuraea soli]MBA2895079.1 CPA1 family monovalent cation:H+ antiporter [Nonomuraea soli]